MMVDMQINGATRGRLITVGLAPAAALAAWGIERSLGADLVLKDGTSVGAGNVVLAAVIASSRPRAVWAFVGSTGLAVSGIGPSWLADGATALLLFGLHFVTAVVVITGFMRTLPVPDCVPVSET
jgi:Family of unknown function (DUF6069)